MAETSVSRDNIVFGLEQLPENLESVEVGCVREVRSEGDAQQHPESTTDGALVAGDVHQDATISDDALGDEILSSLSVTDEDVQRMLAFPQRCGNGAAHPRWLEARHRRLTASRFASACGLRGAKVSKAETVAQMMSMPEANPGQSMRFGIVNEAKARREYVQKRQLEQAEVSGPCLDTFKVLEVGLCIFREAPWLACSPDGICHQDGVPVGLLEIKTARSWNSWFDDSPPVDWAYQVQGCLRIAASALRTPLAWCDLFFWTPSRSEIRRVAFDDDLWERAMYPRLRCFYFDSYLPRLLEKERAARLRAIRVRDKHAKKRGARKGK